MIRVIFACALVLLIVAACSPASAAFQPNTAYEPTLGPTPQGLAAATPVPLPTGTAVPTQAPTEGPTSSAPPTPTPSITPTVHPQSFMIAVTDTQIAPGSITVSKGRFVRLMIQNQGSVDYELMIQNLKPDNVLADESMAGNLPRDTLDKVTNDAQNGAVHLFAAPQGTANVSFVANQTGTFPFTIKIGGHTLTGSLVVQ